MGVRETDWGSTATAAREPKHKTLAFLSRPSGFYVARAKRLRGTVWRLREDGESARFWL